MQPLPGEKLQLQLSYQKRAKKRNRKLTRHHNVAQHFGGRGNGYKGDEDYLAMLDAEHHQLFHKLFGLRTFRQAADVLLRLDQMHTA
jgi:hypothetical protein